MLHLLHYAHRFKHGGRSFSPLVAGMGASAFYGLLKVVRCQKAETNGHESLQRNLGYALGSFGADDVKMRGAAADYRAKGNDARINPLAGNFFAHHWQFKCSRHLDDRDVISRSSMPDQIVNCTVHQAPDNKIIEAGGHNGYFQSLGIKLPLYGLHSVHFFLARRGIRTAALLFGLKYFKNHPTHWQA